jgi:hypothetical protein
MTMNPVPVISPGAAFELFPCGEKKIQTLLHLNRCSINQLQYAYMVVSTG